MFKDFYILWENYPVFQNFVYVASGIVVASGIAVITHTIATIIVTGIVRLLLGSSALTRPGQSYKVTKRYQTVAVYPHPGPGIPQRYRQPTTATMGFKIPIHTTPAHGDILLPVKKPLERDDPVNPYLVQAYGNNSKLTMRINPGNLWPEDKPPRVELKASPYKPPARRYLNPNLPVNAPYDNV